MRVGGWLAVCEAACLEAEVVCSPDVVEVVWDHASAAVEVELASRLALSGLQRETLDEPRLLLVAHARARVAAHKVEKLVDADPSGAVLIARLVDV
jgi:hypothetical protein